jgi:hypothetical protein
VSFTQYRCLVVFLGYTEYRAELRRTGNNPSFQGFTNYLDNVALAFGVNPNSPHTQGPFRVNDPNFNQWMDGLLMVRQQWLGF